MYLIQTKTSLVRTPTGTFTNNEVILWQHIVVTGIQTVLGVEKLLSAATCSYRPIALEKRRVDMLAVPRVPKQHICNQINTSRTAYKNQRQFWNDQPYSIYTFYVKKKSFIFLRCCPFACHCLRPRNVKQMCLLNAVAMNNTT